MGGASLCLVGQPSCPVRDGLVRFQVQLGAADATVIGGQFFIDYDPAVLELWDIQPGIACDATSPFETELFRAVDSVIGRITYGVSAANPLGGGGTMGPATMACVSFIIRASSATDVCLIEPGNPYYTQLVDPSGMAIPVDNSVDCPAVLPLLSCETVAAAGNFCTCGGEEADCSYLENPCNRGVCSSVIPAICVRKPNNEGGPCDDGNSCTATDVCLGGVCIGTECENPSLCVVIEPGCPVPDGLLRLRVELGTGVPIITAGQFSLNYEPSDLQFVSITPGQTCDPGSPFSLELLAVVDDFFGEIWYGVGVDFQTPGTSGPATMACVTFRVISSDAGDVCLFDSGNAFPARLSDASGFPIAIDNADTCYTPQLPPTLSCANYSVSSTCTCPDGSADCHGLDDDCVQGICVEGPAHCEATSANEDQPCDDGIECTSSDRCVDGACRGTNCFNPSVCLIPGPSCAILDGLVRYSIRLGAGVPVISGGQFEVEFDPSVLEFVDIVPGQYCDFSSPFTLELFETIDSFAGRLRYGVGVNPFIPGGGTQGPATLACAVFRVVGGTDSEVCLVPGDNPYHTRLGDPYGFPVEIFNLDDCPSADPFRALTCTPLTVRSTCFCPEGVPDCSDRDSDCQRGVCGGVPARCESEFINEGQACFSGNPCNLLGSCTEGTCVTPDCPQFPSMCVVPDGPCAAPGVNRFRVVLGFSEALMVGGQVWIEYDPTILQLKESAPGSACDPNSPFILEIYESIDAIEGVIQFAYGVNPLDPDRGTHGPVTLACLTFNRLTDEDDASVCIFEGINPFHTRIADKTGFEVPIDNSADCPSPSGPPVVTCEPVCRIPTVSHWGLVVLTLLLLSAEKVRALRGAGVRA